MLFFLLLKTDIIKNIGNQYTVEVSGRSCTGFKLVTQLCCIDQQKAARFESGLCVSDSFCHAVLLIMTQADECSNTQYSCGQQSGIF